MRYVEAFKQHLRERLCFGKTAEERGMEWWEYAMVMWSKRDTPLRVGFSQIATHGHFVVASDEAIFKEKAPIIKLFSKAGRNDYALLAALLNSSAALFWLKQVCFNKGAGEDEERDRFEYQGNKLEELPVPTGVADAWQAKSHRIAELLLSLCDRCLKAGQRMPALALSRVFEKLGEAYYDWNQHLPVCGVADPGSESSFDSAEDLRRVYETARSTRDLLRTEMISLQEEMDWLVYAAYDLLPEDHPAAQAEAEPAPLEREQRPFVLWAEAEGNYDQAVKLIPAGWPAARKKLWEARLTAIRDNEHIRRIEQPVYKRRWDEQWKVGNQWRCGPIAYAAEFIEAFEWWLREKAEWWLENKKDGGPVEIEAWTEALWRDSRIQAAWPVAAEQYAFLEAEKAREKAEENGEPLPAPTKPATDAAGFRREFKRIIEDETVPAGFPFAVPSLVGRMLGYGTVIVRGTGGTFETFDKIAHPNELRRQVQQQTGSSASA